MSKRLILHIGGHKTGSTSIQKALYLNRDSLREQGYRLFSLSPEGVDNQDGKPALWIRPITESPNRSLGAHIEDGLAAALGSMDGSVIFSQENLSWVFAKDELLAFRSKLKESFDQITVIAYLRRQDQLAISHHQEGSKNHYAMSSRYYGDSEKALPPYQEHFDLYLDYHKRLGMWADVFGDDNLILRLFERDRMKSGDSVQDFGNALGLILTGETLRQNESRGFELTKVGHLMTQAKVPIRLRKFIKRYLDNSGKLLPSRTEAQNFFALFSTSNQLLNRRFKISDQADVFSDDFSMYSESPQDEWSEQTANLALSHILRAASEANLLCKNDAELILECSRSLESSDPQLANELRKVTRRQRREKGQDRKGGSTRPQTHGIS